MTIPFVEFRSNMFPEIPLITKPLIRHYGYLGKIFTALPAGSHPFIEIVKRISAAALAVFALPVLGGLYLMGKIVFCKKNSSESLLRKAKLGLFTQRASHVLNGLIFDAETPCRWHLKAEIGFNPLKPLKFTTGWVECKGKKSDASDSFNKAKKGLREWFIEEYGKYCLSADYQARIEMAVIETVPASPLESCVNVCRFQAEFDALRSSIHPPSWETFEKHNLDGINEGIKLISIDFWNLKTIFIKGR